MGIHISLLNLSFSITEGKAFKGKKNILIDSQDRSDKREDKKKRNCRIKKVLVPYDPEHRVEDEPYRPFFKKTF